MDFYNERALRSTDQIIRDMEITTCDLYGSVIELTLRLNQEIDERCLSHTENCPKCAQIMRKWQRPKRHPT